MTDASPPDPENDQPFDTVELDDLLDALREDLITQAQHERLVAVLKGSAAARRRYVRYMTFCAALRQHAQGEPMPAIGPAQRRTPSLEDPTGNDGSLAGLELDEAMILPAISADDAPAPAQDETPPVWHRPREAVARRRFPRSLGIAAAILLCVTGALLVRWATSKPTFATVSSSLDARIDGQPVVPGTRLREDEVRLTAGVVELIYDSGVKVVVEAPARFVPRPKGGLLLAFGKLTAVVPPQASGFTVETPVALVKDLGTEFGVSVTSAGDVAATVFRGKVVLDAPQSPGGAAKTMELAAGQSAKADSAGLRSAPQDQAYVRDIRQVTAPIPIHSTGQAIGVGELDENWEVTRVENDPVELPGPAFALIEPDKRYAPNDGRSKWISVGPDAPPVAARGQYTFATTFDLAHLNPSTARLQLRLAVDNGITAVRLNGADTGIRLETSKKWMDSLWGFEINQGFVPGVNRLEFVVENFEPARGVESPVGLRAELSGSAAREVNSR